MIAHAIGGLVELLPQEFLVRQHEPVAYAQRIADLLSEQKSALPVILPAELHATRNAGRVVAVYRNLLGIEAQQKSRGVDEV
jgi:hypothetical protein